MDQRLVAGRYLLREPVGAGGMGRVWLARDEVLHREVAVKEVVPPAWLTDAERGQLRELTLREARAAARLNHPHVVKIYDVLHTERWPWIVMEYVPSRSLQQVLEESGPLAPERVAEIGVAVLDALRAAHRAGVVHRDVKPHNVLIGHDGRVVLTDFGLATLDTDGGITRPGLIATPQYLAPERARMGTSSVESDLWSLGATLYAAVEGRTPYARPTVVETLTALATLPPDPVRLAGPLRPVIEGLLRREPKTRLSSSDVDRMLRRAAAGEPITPRLTRRHRQLIVAALVVAALGAGTGALAANRDPGGQSGPGGLTAEQLAELAAANQGVVACERTPVHTEPVRGQSGPPGSYPLVDGFTWQFRPGSWGVAVPVGWLSWHDGATACFADPRGGRVLAVDPARPASTDPLAGAVREEARLTEAGLLPAYQRIALAPQAMVAPTAEWEFIYDRAGTRRHAIVLVVSHPAGDVVVYWATDDRDFGPNRAFYNVVKASFRPPPPPGGRPPGSSSAPRPATVR
ncbi:MAG: serine/threonine protein kinase [Hamadaea sp.]|nr:serine/threonine protein kinase [Hamadaea sp.]